MKCKWRKAARLILLLIIAVCLFQMGRAYYHKAEYERQIGKIEQLKTDGENSQDMPVKGEIDEERDQEASVAMPDPVMLDQYRLLYEENSDIVGWLSIEGTPIDYPVMQCGDDEYYLHHDFYGEDSKYGCLYVRGRADLEKGTNFLIYGHNMRDNSMFGSLDEYRDEEYCREHSEISFDTLYEERHYEIVAVFLSQVYKEDEDVFKYYEFYEAESEEAFDYFYDNIKNLALYDTGVEAEYGDRFLTLSTCAYHVTDGRLAVVARLVPPCGEDEQANEWEDPEIKKGIDQLREPLPGG